MTEGRVWHETELKNIVPGPRSENFIVDLITVPQQVNLHRKKYRF